MTQVTWSNIDTIKPGCRIFYGGRYDTLIADPRYTGGVRCGGSSLHAILEDYASVFFVE